MWSKREALAQLAEGAFRGYILDAAMQLHPRLPADGTDIEDIIQEMSIYALEAIDAYVEAASRAKFTTFLVKHLRLRSFQWFNWSWLPKNTPKGKFVSQFSVLQDDELDTFEPQDYSNRPLNLDQKAFVQSLSNRSQQIFESLMQSYSDQCEASNGTSTVRLFKLQGPTSAVMQLSGCSQDDAEQFVDECFGRASRFIA